MQIRTIWIRKTHRYLGLLVGIQLLFWTVSGLFFAWNDIKTVRGETLIRKQTPSFRMDTVQFAPLQRIYAAVHNAVPGDKDFHGFEMRELLGEPVAEISYTAGGHKHFALVHAKTGALRSGVTPQEAERIAKADFLPDAEVESVQSITAVEDNSEYREKPLPAYCVTFRHETGTRIYVSAERGLVTARRNGRWRLWDFLWAFHILDFETRDNIHNLLLRGMSGFAVITVLSGFSLWAWTTPLLRRKRGNNNNNEPQ